MVVKVAGLLWVDDDMSGSVTNYLTSSFLDVGRTKREHMLEIAVVVRARWVGFHQWSSAPEQLAYLRDLHRHEFHVELSLRVNSEHREVETHTLKRQLLSFLDSTYPAGVVGEASCETMCLSICNHFGGVVRVSILEDGESGAEVTRGG